MTPIQKHIADHIRHGKFDVSQSVDSQVSVFNFRCLVGMVETGEATYDDLMAVGGTTLTAAVAKSVTNAYDED